MEALGHAMGIDLHRVENVAAESLGHVKRVMFELHNRCHLATVHTKCPLHAHRGDAPSILPARVVDEVMAYLATQGWVGRVSLHNYNDPMLDPRLFDLIRTKIKAMVPDCTVFLMTNGWLLDQTMLYEMAGLVDSLEVSAYSQAEGSRLNALKAPSGIKYVVKVKKDLDDRLAMYSEDLSVDRAHRHCNAPLCEIVIRSTGIVSMCCFDWNDHKTYGNLTKESLATVLGRGEMLADFNRLSRGERTEAVCKNCWVTRE